jgi:hypothetical protein
MIMVSFLCKMHGESPLFFCWIFGNLSLTELQLEVYLKYYVESLIFGSVDPAYIWFYMKLKLNFVWSKTLFIIQNIDMIILISL